MHVDEGVCFEWQQAAEHLELPGEVDVAGQAGHAVLLLPGLGCQEQQGEEQHKMVIHIKKIIGY